MARDKRRKPGVYLDTSVISALFDARNPERQSLTETFWSSKGDFELFISEITIAEVERTPDGALRSKMKQAMSDCSVLPLSDEVEWLAHEYIRNGAISGRLPGRCLSYRCRGSQRDGLSLELEFQAHRSTEDKRYNQNGEHLAKSQANRNSSTSRTAVGGMRWVR